MARILLVTADKISGKLLYNLLKQWGHTVEACSSYSNAIEQFRLIHKHYPYTLIIADQCLPETEGGTVLDIQKSVQLVRKILKTKKRCPIKRCYVALYPLCPEIILLSSFTGENSSLFSGYFYPGKKKKGETHIYPAVNIVHKGTELEKQLKQLVKELEITYWKRRYRIACWGLIPAAFLGSNILIKNFSYGFTFNSLLLIAGIAIMYIVLYFFQILPNHPSRAATYFKKHQ